MAGAGKRFADAGYTVPKPLIPIAGTPMVVRAAKPLPPSARLVFVCLAEHLGDYPIAEELLGAYPNAEFVALSEMTDGQACSCAAGIELAELSLDEPLLISNCDDDVVYDAAAFQQLLDTGPDAVVWTFRHTPCSRANPKAYGWVDVDAEGRVKRISPKVPISDDPWNDHAETGKFWFRSAGLFMDGMQAMYRNDTKTNNEYYVANVLAELLAAGANVRVFEVERFICWGTPDDLDRYEYWRRYFNERGTE